MWAKEKGNSIRFTKRKKYTIIQKSKEAAIRLFEEERKKFLRNY